MKTINHQKGITLVELMVALVLGLLIMAAALQIYLSGLSGYKMQKALSDVQDNVGFGLSYVLNDLRKINLNAEQSAISDTLPDSGLIISTQNLGSDITLNCTDCLKNIWGGANVDGKNNSQLLIRFQATADTYDCSGKELKKNNYVVQRYFVGATASDARSSLRCSAAQYAQTVKGAGAKEEILFGNSNIIIPNVDYFTVKVGYIQGSLYAPEKIEYVSVENYLKLAKQKTNVDGIISENRPYIYALKLGLILPSTDSAGVDTGLKQKNQADFNVLGEDVKLKAVSQDNKLRQVVEQTITLRNALGWNNEGCKVESTGCNGGSL
jgi:type IV pilus assembly protein PilW